MVLATLVKTLIPQQGTLVALPYQSPESLQPMSKHLLHNHGHSWYRFNKYHGPCNACQKMYYKTKDIHGIALPSTMVLATHAKTLITQQGTLMVSTYQAPWFLQPMSKH